MGKEGLTRYEAQLKRIHFIEEAVGKGVLEKIRGKEIGQNIAFVYNLNDAITAEEMRKVFPESSGKLLSKQRIIRASKSFLTKAWMNVGPQMQASYPLEELHIKKPISLSPVNARIEENFSKEGVNLIAIRDKEGITALNEARPIFRNRGIEIPLMPKKTTKYEEFKAKIKAAKNYKELQEILDNHPIGSLHGYISKHGKDGKKALMTLSPFLREKGFYCPLKELDFFVKKLKKNGIPIRRIDASSKESKYTQTNWIMLSKRRRKLTEVLRKNPYFQRFNKNPAQIICGNSEKIPTTYLLRSKQYSSGMRRVIKEITGYTVGGKGYMKIEGLLQGCPIPVFKFDHRYLYPTARIEELKAFIRSKQKES
jgi:hypothetical protein